MKLNNLCPICSCKNVEPFLTRKCVPIHQNMVIKNQESAKKSLRGDIELFVCSSCGFIYNNDFNSELLLYDNQYDNTQSCSPLFSKYLHERITHLVVDHETRNKKIIEIGCGKGQFLKELCKFENVGIGFDPSYSDIDDTNKNDNKICFKKQLFNESCNQFLVDVVICRHVIEHIPNPVHLLKTIKNTLINSSHVKIYFETPCVEWILNNRVIWDFFYEHCSYFNKNSLTTLFEISGFKVENIEHTFDGQYLWLEASIPQKRCKITKNSQQIKNISFDFFKKENEYINKWKIKIQKMLSIGKVAVWGAGAKGVTFVNLIDPNYEWIDCVVDLNPNKQGHYVSGTGHPIVSYQELVSRGVRTAILMNPNYYTENYNILNKEHINIELVE